MGERWRIELLGGLRAVQGDRVVTRFRTQKTGLLLACLAFHTIPGSRSPRSFPREQLMELLWPEVECRAGLNHLKATLHWLRQELEPPGAPFGSVLHADRTSVGLDPAAVTTDIAEFAAALEAAARAATSAERAVLVARAVELYQGELLSGCHDEWVLQERQWLTERFFQALSQQIAHLEQAGDLSRAVELAQWGVGLDSLREEAHAELMRLCADRARAGTGSAPGGADRGSERSGPEGLPHRRGGRRQVAADRGVDGKCRVFGCSSVQVFRG